jgi:ribonuclease P protein subunit POP4
MPHRPPILLRDADVKVAVPKRHSIFRFEVPQPGISSPVENDTNDCKILNEGASSDTTAVGLSKPYVFELHGSSFESRAPDRATKKFKQRRIDV